MRKIILNGNTSINEFITRLIFTTGTGRPAQPKGPPPTEASDRPLLKQEGARTRVPRYKAPSCFRRGRSDASVGGGLMTVNSTVFGFFGKKPVVLQS
ncbi:hypothetical protein [Spirosoma pollinicola]|uniref:Uncharacterized protein n=1 Tax=Spirosoma pollinicola TaxID=2057025 RepID=A0A2K8Z0B0_9BACT|nr:hypothetical protein [Spirosoma pollinicola]AUD03330.1 hypothetical protein CWM47_16710 [Spirosoma pollinicola]